MTLFRTMINDRATSPPISRERWVWGISTHAAMEHSERLSTIIKNMHFFRSSSPREITASRLHDVPFLLKRIQNPSQRTRSAQLYGDIATQGGPTW